MEFKKYNHLSEEKNISQYWEKKGFFKRIILPDGEKVHEGQSVLLQVRSIGAKDKVHLFTNNIISIYSK